MASFKALLEGAEMPTAELFARAWSLWGANMRSITADPQAFSAEVDAATMLFSFLSSSAGELSTKQQGQVQTVTSMLSSLAILNEPEPPAPPSPESPQSKHYAGMRSAPNPNALPAPSLLFGKASPPSSLFSSSILPSLVVAPSAFCLELVPPPRHHHHGFLSPRLSLSYPEHM